MSTAPQITAIACGGYRNETVYGLGSDGLVYLWKPERFMWFKHFVKDRPLKPVEPSDIPGTKQ